MRELPVLGAHRLHSGDDGGDDEHGGEDDHDPVGEVVDVEVERDPAAHHQQDGLEWETGFSLEAFTLQILQVQGWVNKLWSGCKVF